VAPATWEPAWRAAAVLRPLAICLGWPADRALRWRARPALKPQKAM